MSFSERFPEKCSTVHSNARHYKEGFECSFHSRKYWSRVTWIDCNQVIRTLVRSEYKKNELKVKWIKQNIFERFQMIMRMLQFFLLSFAFVRTDYKFNFVFNC